MLERNRGEATQHVTRTSRTSPPSRARRPRFDCLEHRQLLAASLDTLPAISVPRSMGYQVPLHGGTGAGDQTFSATSSNPAVKATVARGKFLTINVIHTGTGTSDPFFQGSLTFQLFDDLTPTTTAKIESLVTSGFYSGKNFHRILAGFPGPTDYIAQGGSVNGDGTGDVGKPGFPFADEFVQQLAFTGTGQLAMANANSPPLVAPYPPTNTSQFFVTTGTPTFLDYRHTIFGQLVEGQDVLTKMTQVAKNSAGRPTSPVLIQSAALTDTSPDGVIHVDTTQATAGQSADITVTATEPATNTTTSRTFHVGVTAGDSTLIQQGPVANPIAMTLNENVPTTVQLTGTPSSPSTSQALTFEVLTQPSHGTVSVNATTGAALYTPASNFIGTDTFTYRVLNVGNPSPNFVSPSAAVTLTVQSGSESNIPPTAQAGSGAVTTNTPFTGKLSGITGNPTSGQTLTFSIINPPTHGTLTSFDPNTGAFTYAPATDFIGTDILSFQVRDVGPPLPNLNSNIATFTFDVAPTSTGAVRLVNRVLVVTPLPRTDKGTNTIDVTQTNGLIQVKVNGVIDSTRPSVTALDRLVIYGTKANDNITIAPDVTLPATLDGGHGGKNIIVAGGGQTREHGWFGRNTLTGGPQSDALIGRAGHARFVESAGNDLLFLGHPHHPNVKHGKGIPPGGTYYRFVNHHLVALPNPTPQGTPHRHGTTKQLVIKPLGQGGGRTA